MIEFEKPNIHKVEETDSYGKFVVEPLERGYGTTLGNSLRRVLLASLPGAAITNSNHFEPEESFSKTGFRRTKGS